MDEILSFLKELLIDDAYLMVGALWLLGKFIKESPFEKEWLIPFILLPFGIAGSVAFIGLNAHAFIQGVIVTGLAVYGNELYKQSKERD